MKNQGNLKKKKKKLDESWKKKNCTQIFEKLKKNL